MTDHDAKRATLDAFNLGRSMDRGLPAVDIGDLDAYATARDVLRACCAAAKRDRNDGRVNPAEGVR